MRALCVPPRDVARAFPCRPLYLRLCWPLLVNCAHSLRLTKPNNRTARAAAADASRLKLETSQCGAVRFNYKCNGEEYDSYLETQGAALNSIYAKAGATSLDKKFLFLGNSHIREVAEALLCQRRRHIKKWSHLGWDGCMQDSQYSDKCDGWFGPCKDELLRAAFDGGGSVHVASNHPWLYRGTEGLQKLFGLLELNVSALDVVVVGVWNSEEWAVKKFGIQRAVPLCVHEDEEGDPFEFFGLKALTAEELGQTLQKHGFKGQVLLGGMFEPMTSKQALLHERLLQQRQDYSFGVESLAPFPQTCASPECRIHEGHQCLPGPPDFVAQEVARGR